MAPPALAKPKGGRAPRRRRSVRFGPWLLPLLKVLARGKALRGTPFDPFGRTEERQLERRLIDEYEARVAELLAGLDAGQGARSRWRSPTCRRRSAATATSSWRAWRSRGRARSELLNRFDPERYPRPAGPAVAGQFRGIPVTSA